MPVIKSAKKKLRQDKKRTAANKKIFDQVKKIIKKAKKETSDKTIRAAVASIDKATKKKIFHKNKAARLKSQLAKIMNAPSIKKTKANKPQKSKKRASK